jgi:hypothetical protein
MLHTKECGDSKLFVHEMDDGNQQLAILFDKSPSVKVHTLSPHTGVKPQSS